jgi:hypothetical protein
MQGCTVINVSHPFVVALGSEPLQSGKQVTRIADVDQTLIWFVRSHDMMKQDVQLAGNEVTLAFSCIDILLKSSPYEHEMKKK